MQLPGNSGPLKPRGFKRINKGGFQSAAAAPLPRCLIPVATIPSIFQKMPNGGKTAQNPTVGHYSSSSCEPSLFSDSISPETLGTRQNTVPVNGNVNPVGFPPTPEWKITQEPQKLWI